MSTFDCQCADLTAAAPPDPRKHVNYVQGMVLGVDDLTQEFAYHQHQRQWLARDALGYGTLSGLQVKLRNDLKVSVSPGTALSPRGHLIRVAPEQCAALNDWLRLDTTRKEIQGLGNRFQVYVVLCFRDCPVDELPVPGEPCRCEDQAKAPSRVLDDFRLELRLSPPAQREEDAVRDFVQWIRQIKVVDNSAGASSVAAVLDAIRAAAQDRLSPLESPPDFLYGSPPSHLAIPATRLCEYLRAALKLWVVELRPIWQAQWGSRTGGGCGCHGDEQTVGGNAEECLLLAALDVRLTGGQVAAATDVVVDDSRRPFVVSLRLLQEMLLCGPCCGGGCHDRTFATVFALDDHTLRIWIHHPVPVTFDPSAVGLEIDQASATVVNISPVMPGTNVFDLDLGASPPTTIRNGSRVALTLNTDRMTEAVSPPRTLAEAAATDGWCHADSLDGKVTVRILANLAGHSMSALDAVEHPPGLSSYMIVAAGIVSGRVNQAGTFASDDSRLPVYNNLRVVDITAGRLLINYDGYSPPPITNPPFQLIVKALPISRQGQMVLVNFAQFRGQTVGIELQISFLTGAAPTPAEVADCEFHIEISRFARA